MRTRNVFGLSARRFVAQAEWGLWIAALITALGCASSGRVDQVRRLSPKEAHEKLESKGALLVCAYEKGHCPGTHLVGSITLEELRSRFAGLPPDQAIILYCG